MPLIIRNYQQSYQPSENNGKALFNNGALAAKAEFSLTVSMPANTVTGSFPWLDTDYDGQGNYAIFHETDTISTDAYAITIGSGSSTSSATFPFHDLSAPSCAVPELVADRRARIAWWQSADLHTAISTYFSAATMDTKVSLFAPYWGQLGGQMPEMGNRACSAGEGIWSLWFPMEYHAPMGHYLRPHIFAAWLYTAMPSHDIGAGLVFPFSSLDLKFY